MALCKDVEGGFIAWAVVISSFMIHFLQSGFSDSFGLILPSIKTVYETNNTEGSLTNSLTVFFTLGSSPVAAIFIKKIGHRLTMVVGVIFAFSGLLIAGLYTLLWKGNSDGHPNILVLYFSAGVMTGVGFGFTYLPSVDIVKMHFEKNLGLACGIAASGTGFGQFVMAPIVSLLQDHYGLPGTLLGFSALFGAFLIFCIFFSVPSSVNNNKTDSKENKKPKGFWEIFTGLKHPSKIFLILHVLLLNLCIYAIFTFYAERAMSFGISEENSSYLLSMMGFANFISRITSGIVIDKFRSKAFAILTAVHIINGLSIISSQFITSFPGQAATAIIFGAGFGAKVTCMVVIVGIIVEDITFLLSIIYLCVGISSFAGPTLVGILLDVSGSYLPGFMTVGGVFLLGAFCLPLSWWSLQKEQRLETQF